MIENLTEADYQSGLWNSVDRVIDSVNVAIDNSVLMASGTLGTVNIYQTTTLGVAATSPSGDSNRYFSVPSTSSSGYLDLYRNDSGVAVLVKTYPNDVAISEIGIGYQPEVINDLSFVVCDEHGRRTWIEADLAGHPTDRAVELIGSKLTTTNSPDFTEEVADVIIPQVQSQVGVEDMNSTLNEVAFSVVDAEGRRTELEVGLDGRLTDRVISSIASRLGGTNQDFPVDSFACWGDSLTAGGWPAMLATLIGKDVYNGGWGGQGYSQIAARQGGVPARLTLTGNTIPSTGSVVVSSVLNNPLSAGGERIGYIGGILGTLSMSSEGVVTFTRDSSGSEVTVTPLSYFTPYHGAVNRDRHVVIWTGRNSFKTVAPELIVSSIDAMINYLNSRVKRVIVMSIPPWVGEPIGSGVRATLDNCNAKIAAAFPEYWLDISAYLRTTEAATAAGITFTSDDLADIALGYTPRSLRADDGHMNSYGNTAIASRVRQEILNRGWM